MIPKTSLERFSPKKVTIHKYINFTKERECNYMLSFFKIFELYTHVEDGDLLLCVYFFHLKAYC